MKALSESNLSYRPNALRRHEAYLLRLLLRRRLRGYAELLRGEFSWALLYRWVRLSLAAVASLFSQQDLVQRVGPNERPRARHEWDGSRHQGGRPTQWF